MGNKGVFRAEWNKYEEQGINPRQDVSNPIWVDLDLPTVILTSAQAI